MKPTTRALLPINSIPTPRPKRKLPLPEAYVRLIIRVVFLLTHCPIRMCPRTSIISISLRASLSSRTRLVLFITVVDPRLLTACIQQNEGAPENKDLPPASSPDEIKKEDAGDAAAGKEQMTDDQRWARDRTGWAPRFMIENTEDEGTLLDHQTLLEGKLSDKFFGGTWLSGNRHMSF